MAYTAGPNVRREPPMSTGNLTILVNLDRISTLFATGLTYIKVYRLAANVDELFRPLATEVFL